MLKNIFHLPKRQQIMWLLLLTCLFIASQIASSIRINRNPIDNNLLVQLITQHYKFHNLLASHLHSPGTEDSTLISNIVNHYKTTSTQIDPNKHPRYFFAITNLQHAIPQQGSVHKSFSTENKYLEDYNEALLQTINELQDPKLGFNKENISSLAFTQLAIAILAVIITAWYTDESHRIERLKENYKFNNETYDLLLKDKSLLALHQIEPKELKKYNISIEEFVYILKSFHSISAYYTLKSAKNITFTDYRHQFLKSPKVKIAWKHFIKHKFISFKNIIDAIDQFYCQSLNEEND